MLSSANRLRKSYEITRVYKRGSYGSGGGILSVKAARTNRAGSRAVVVVGKKVSKKAVTRNTIRRRIAAIMAEMWGTVLPGYDIVVSVHQEVASLPAPDLRQALTLALQRAGTLPK